MQTFTTTLIVIPLVIAMILLVVFLVGETRRAFRDVARNGRDDR